MRLTLAALIAAAALPARADGVLAICAESAAEPVCLCASDRLAGELGVDEYAQYHRIGWDYALLRERGAGSAEAWKSALAAEVARSGEDARVVRHRADGIARAHRAFIRFCQAG